MSAYAAAYASGGYGIPGARVPKTYAPPGYTGPSASSSFSTPAGGSGHAGAFAGYGGAVSSANSGTYNGAAGGFSYPGVGGTSWTSPEHFIAAVPVRPYEFPQPPRKLPVGCSRGIEEFSGRVARPYAIGKEAEFFLLKGLVSDSQVAEIVATGSKVLSDLIATGRTREPDPTDDRPRFAVDVARKGRCSGPLQQSLEQLVQGALLPYVRERFECPGATLASARFRRFVPEERRFVPPHHEHGALAVAVVELQDPHCFTGGLFVQGSGRAFLDRKFVPMGRGDVCFFGHDLHHGTEVQDGSRFELLLIFKDSPEAAASNTSPWYRDAAEAGDPSAQYGMALAFLDEGDFAAARPWLEKACEQDQPEALYTQASLTWDPPPSSGIKADAARTLQLLRRASELGYGRAQSRLGGLLAAGVKGKVQQDTWEGKRLLRLAFEQDDPDAGFHLGSALLQEGDRDGATKLLAACAKGHPRACFQVAEMYREGQYQFPKDLSQSLRYTKWSAHQGDPQAMSNLGHLLINGLGVVRDEAKAARLFRHAAKLGAPEGQLNYGLALLRGSGGVRIDYQEALEWAQKSAAQGHTLAHQQLSMFFNAAKNPNPPARSQPTSQEELTGLSVRDLRALLKQEGIDFSDCVEKADLVNRAAQHLPGVAEPWDPAPENTLLLEPPKRTRAELLKQQQRMREEQTVTAVSPPQSVPESEDTVGKDIVGKDDAQDSQAASPSPVPAAAASARGAAQAVVVPPEGVGAAAAAASRAAPPRSDAKAPGMAPSAMASKLPEDDDEVIEYEFID